MKIFSLFQLALIAIYTMSCCPPNAEPYLAPDYATVGEIVTLPYGLNIYSTGKVSDLSRAVIILPDVFGWNSGRTRNIADLFASHGYLAVVPQLLAPGLDGGTDGDGLCPGFNTTAERERFMAWIVTYDWKDNLDKKVAAVVDHVKNSGAQKLYGLGFCWGSWALAQALSGDLGQNFRCGVFAHPSVSLETRAFQRDTETVFRNIGRPVLLMNAKGDNTEYYADGPWFKITQENHPTSESHNYLDVNHGFVPRGDLNLPEVKEAVQSALNRTFRFFEAHA